MRFDGYDTRDVTVLVTRPRPSAYRSDPFPDSAIQSPSESFQAGVETVLSKTMPSQPLTLEEAQDRLANVVSQISAINQSLERDRQIAIANGTAKSGNVPEHIMNRRKRASRARNILQQEAAQIRSLIQTFADKAAAVEKASQRKSRTESAWRAYLSAEDVLDAIEGAGGTVGVLGQKYRKRSQSEVPLWFREEWQKTHRNGVFIQPESMDSEPATPLVSVPATMADRLAAAVGAERLGQKLVKYQGKKRQGIGGSQ